ncbi:MAG: TolB-like translocation protein [Deltaproteobacteria bacterium]|nr:TolB-like translocation protein [Deltaproteobacteria bacterium]
MADADAGAATGLVIGSGMLLHARAEQPGTVMIAPLDAPDLGRALPLRCDRVHFAAKRGICLIDTRERVYPPAQAIIFDERARPLARFDLAGVPSRARVSPGGRYASATVFVQGDSYDSPLGMSTRTTIIDLERATVVGDLEQFAVAPEGRPQREAEFNFWGVTFAGDGGRFYATLGAGAETYLLAGDVTSRSLRILRRGVECPSLSPDGRRIAYKHRLADGGWRLHVLELANLRDRPLADLRAYDDQAEWLDDRTVLYGHHEQRIDERTGGAAVNIWALAIDGDAPPRRLVVGGFSPAVVR